MTSPERREEIIIYNILMRPNRSFTELLLLSYHIEAWLRKGRENAAAGGTGR